MSNRTAARWIAAATICGALAIPASSSAVEPTTVIAVIGGVIKAVQGFSANKNSAEWEASASGKLDQIIEQNKQIIADIRDLRLFVPEALETQYKNQLAKQANSYVNRFQVYVQNPYPSPKLMLDLREDAEKLSLLFIEEGPSVYPATAAATTLTLAIYAKSGNVTKEERKAFLDKMLAKMEVWAGDTPGNFGYAIAQERKTINDYRTKLASFARGPEVELHTARSNMSGGMIMPSGFERRFPCTLVLYGAVNIDDQKLTQSVNATGSRGCGAGDRWDDKTSQDFANARANQIQSVLDNIKTAQDRLRTIEHYRKDLLLIMATFKDNFA
ncbi:hypothetical protein Q3C01_28025 [Bradyrhizobium sp. UFLA05-109]